MAATGKMGNHFTTLWDGGHLKFFSVPTMTALLKSENCTNIKFKFAGRFPFYKTYPKLPKSRHIWTAITLVFTSCFITVLEWLLRGFSAPQAISVELTVSDRSS